MSRAWGLFEILRQSTKLTCANGGVKIATPRQPVAIPGSAVQAEQPAIGVEPVSVVDDLEHELIAIRRQSDLGVGGMRVLRNVLQRLQAAEVEDGCRRAAMNAETRATSDGIRELVRRAVRAPAGVYAAAPSVNPLHPHSE